MPARKSEKRYNVTITSGTILRGVLFLLLLGVLFFLRELVVVVLTSVVLASAIEPGTLWLERYRIPRALAVVFLYVLLGTAFTAILIWLVPPLIGDIVGILDKAPEYLRSLETGGALGNISETTITELESIRSNLNVPELLMMFQNGFGNTSAGVFGFISGIFGGIINVILIITISFYLAVQRDGISSFLRIITPIEHERYVIDLWKRSQQKIGLWLQGQFMLMIIVGMLVYILLTIFGIPNALVLALFATIFELIPFFGPVLAAIPGIAAALLEGGLALGVVAFGIYVVVQQFENHIIYPIVVKKVVGVPSIIVVIALVAGAQLAGFLGIILSVPLAAVIMEFVSDVEARKLVELQKIEKAKKKKKSMNRD